MSGTHAKSADTFHHCVSVTLHGSISTDLRPTSSYLEIEQDLTQPWWLFYAKLRKKVLAEFRSVSGKPFDQLDVFVKLGTCVANCLPFLGAKSKVPMPARKQSVLYVQIWDAYDIKSPSHCYSHRALAPMAHTLEVQVFILGDTPNDLARKGPSFCVTVATDQCVRAFRKNLDAQLKQRVGLPSSTEVSIFFSASKTGDSLQGVDSSKKAKELFEEKVVDCHFPFRPLDVQLRIKKPGATVAACNIAASKSSGHKSRSKTSLPSVPAATSAATPKVAVASVGSKSTAPVPAQSIFPTSTSSKPAPAHHASSNVKDEAIKPSTPATATGDNSISALLEKAAKAAVDHALATKASHASMTSIASTTSSSTASSSATLKVADSVSGSPAPAVSSVSATAGKDPFAGLLAIINSPKHDKAGSATAASATSTADKSVAASEKDPWGYGARMVSLEETVKHISEVLQSKSESSTAPNSGQAPVKVECRGGDRCEAARGTVQSMLGGFLLNLNRSLAENFGEAFGEIKEVKAETKDSSDATKTVKAQENVAPEASSAPSTQTSEPTEAKATETPPEPSKEKTEPVKHAAICDLCDDSIYGVRYKCLDCPDWDCCGACQPSVAAKHPGHRFVRASEADSIPPHHISKLPRHRFIVCDHCDGNVHGIRYKCIACPDFDLCMQCESLPSQDHAERHGPNHLFLKITVPADSKAVAAAVKTAITHLPKVQRDSLLSKAACPCPKTSGASVLSGRVAPAATVCSAGQSQPESQVESQPVAPVASAAPEVIAEMPRKPDAPIAAPASTSREQTHGDLSSSTASAEGSKTSKVSKSKSNRAKLEPLDSKMLRDIVRGLVATAMADQQKAKHGKKHSSKRHDDDDDESRDSAGLDRTDGKAKKTKVARVGSGNDVEASIKAGATAGTAGSGIVFEGPRTWHPSFLSAELESAAKKTEELIAKIKEITSNAASLGVVAEEREVEAPADGAAVPAEPAAALAEGGAASKASAPAATEQPLEVPAVPAADEGKEHEKAEVVGHAPVAPFTFKAETFPMEASSTANAAATRVAEPSPATVPVAPVAVPSVISGDKPMTKRKELDAAFVRDISFPDGSVVAAGARFDKVWLVRNTGSKPWPKNVGLKLVASCGKSLVEGRSSLQPIGHGFDGRLVKPDEEVEVCCSNLQAPEEAGGADVYWRLAAPSPLRSLPDVAFGEQLWISVRVVDPADDQPADDGVKAAASLSSLSTPEGASSSFTEVRPASLSSLSGSSVFHAPKAPESVRSEHASPARVSAADEMTSDRSELALPSSPRSTTFSSLNGDDYDIEGSDDEASSFAYSCDEVDHQSDDDGFEIVE